MNADLFDYPLPEACVAQEPAARRDQARLMVLDRRTGGVTDASVADLGRFLRPGDLLVLNDTRVIPARLRARKPTGGRVDLVLIEAAAGDASVWTCFASTTRGLVPGARLTIAPDFEADYLGEAPGRRVRVRLRAPGGDVEAGLREHGRPPLPPYILRREDDPRETIDRERYQTVYASRAGAIAAPTAGLHFTAELLEALARGGVERVFLTLHVGPGTFQPLRASSVEEHRVEPERYRLSPGTCEAIAACRARGGRVAAVGTTVVRVLEGRAGPGGVPVPGEGLCDATVGPEHRFRVVDVLLTNFHLPRTSLLVLVSAFAGRERVLAAYRRAVDTGYRFYSYGDAMLIL